jgi:hypothetical protein
VEPVTPLAARSDQAGLESGGWAVLLERATKVWPPKVTTSSMR